MKAILMLSEMPNCCAGCPLFHLIHVSDDEINPTICKALCLENKKGGSTRLEDCPLIEINDNIARMIEVAR